MRPAQRLRSAVRWAPLATIVLVAACGGGGKAPVDQAASECSAVAAAAHQMLLVNPRTVGADELERIQVAAANLNDVATPITTSVGPAARRLAATAQLYAEALQKRDPERATAEEGLLRQQAVPVAQACGFGDRADQVLGTTSETTG